MQSTVLIVEDEPEMRHDLSVLVRACGFRVATAANGVEATAMLSTTSVDVVLTDISMPHLDGYDLIRWMNECGFVQPVIVLTGYHSLEGAVTALRHGAYDYITKPSELEDVAAALRRAEADVARRRADAALVQRNRELAALNVISIALNGVLDLDQLLQRALVTTVDALGLNGGMIYHRDKQQGLQLCHTHGQLDTLLAQTPDVIFPDFDRGIALGEDQVIQLLGVDNFVWQGAATLEVAIPLLNQTEPCGLLLLVGHTDVPFPYDQWTLFESIGNYIGVAIANSRLYSEVRRTAERMEQLVVQRTQELQHNRDLLRTVFDGIPGGLLLTEPDGTILTTNRAYASAFECASTALLSQSYAQIWQSTWSYDAATLFQHCVETQQSVSCRVRLKRSDQSPMVFDRYLFPVNDEHGHLVQVIEYLENVTDRIALERVLAQTEQLAALGKLAATVAHEVNTPLLAIRGCLGLIANGRHDEQTHTEYLALAESELDRAANIIHTILEFYRSAGNGRTAVDMNYVIENIVQLLGAECRQRTIQIVTTLDPLLPTLHVSSDQMKQVMLNLLMNAIEALVDGGTITVGTRRQYGAASIHQREPSVVLVVEDTGPGVPNDLRTQAFDAFVTTKEVSSGLGLAICRTIIHEHGGTISIEEAPSGGARFVVCFPPDLATIRITRAFDSISMTQQ